MLKFLFASTSAAAVLALVPSARAMPRAIEGARASSFVVRVGQPNPGGPVTLHGVVRSVDPGAHRIDIGQLSGAEYFWGQTAQNVPVDASLNLDGLAAGTRVRFTLARGADARYRVSAIRAD
jgi:hypothetical protein